MRWTAAILAIVFLSTFLAAIFSTIMTSGLRQVCKMIPMVHMGWTDLRSRQRPRPHQSQHSLQVRVPGLSLRHQGRRLSLNRQMQMRRPIQTDSSTMILMPRPRILSQFHGHLQQAHHRSPQHPPSRNRLSLSDGHHDAEKSTMSRLKSMTLVQRKN